MDSYILEEFEYKQYLAEQELYDKLSVISIQYNGIITEANVEIVTEAVKETIMAYIRKIVANIQNVWNRFKEFLNDDKYDNLKRDYGKYFESNFILKINDDEFLIPDFDELDKLLNLSIPSNLQSILDDLHDEEVFIKKNFSEFYEDGKTIPQVAEKKILKKITDAQKTVVADTLKPYIGYLEDYRNKADKASSDIKNINMASRNVESILSSIENVSNTVNTNQQSAEKSEEKVGEMNLDKTMSYYFHETDNTPKFSSGTPQGQINQSAEKSNDIKKQINNYFKVCTSVLSTKLSMINKVERICFSIVKNFVVLASKENTNQSETKKEKQTDEKGSTQVKL